MEHEIPATGQSISQTVTLVYREPCPTDAVSVTLAATQTITLNRGVSYTKAELESSSKIPIPTIDPVACYTMDLAVKYASSGSMAKSTDSIF